MRRRRNAFCIGRARGTSNWSKREERDKDVARLKRISLPAAEIVFGADNPLAKARNIALGIGVLALAVAFLLTLAEPARFLASYLVAFLFFLTLALGGLIFVLIQFVTRAGWSVAVRRQAENLMGTLPLFVILFLPLLLGLHHLYVWLDAEHIAHDPILLGKQSYLNAPFFVARSFVYLLSWAGLAFWLRRQSLRQDEDGDPRITRRLQNVSAPAIVWYAITLTFASFDWIMSLDPHWHSTIFGVYVFSGAFMSALAFLILHLLVFQRYGLLASIVNAEHFHDLGKLLFAFVVFWAYIAFSQFMLIWYAAIPEETAWYAHRWGHGWEYVSVLLAVGHFVLPFFLLLSRGAKRNRTVLTLATVWLLGMHYLDLYWLVMPALPAGEFSPHPVDLLTFLGVGGFFLAVLVRLAIQPALVPTRDPRLAESLSFENI
jgi:hypothetical protein